MKLCKCLEILSVIKGVISSFSIWTAASEKTTRNKIFHKPQTSNNVGIPYKGDTIKFYLLQPMSPKPQVKAFQFGLFFSLFFFCSVFSSAWEFKNAFESYGDVTQITMPASVALYTVYKRDYASTLYFGEVFAIAQGTTLLLKNTVKEKRPDGADQSFPSGHTMAAFTSAAFLDQRYNIKAKYWFYGAATLVGISRITSNRHWTHDVITGALIGVLSNKLLVKPLEKQKLVFVPYFDGKKFYTQLSLGF